MKTRTRTEWYMDTPSTWAWRRVRQSQCTRCGYWHDDAVYAGPTYLRQEHDANGVCTTCWEKRRTAADRFIAEGKRLGVGVSRRPAGALPHFGSVKGAM